MNQLDDCANVSVFWNYTVSLHEILREEIDYLHIEIDKHLWSFSKQFFQSNMILREDYIVLFSQKVL